MFAEKPAFEEEEVEKKGSFVGTEDYIAPEIINSELSTFASDLWSMGVIAYQVLFGKTPFKCNGDRTTFDRILECNYDFPPDSQVSNEAKDLI